MSYVPRAHTEEIETMLLVQTIAPLPSGSVGDHPTEIALTAIAALQKHVEAGGDIASVLATVDFDQALIRWRVVLRSTKA